MEEPNEEQRELIFNLSMMEQQAQQLQQQLQAVDQGIIELNSLILGLDKLIGGEGKEIKAQIGRGIFVDAKVLSEKLTVDIGGKNFVKKSIKDTKEMINEQLSKLEEVKKELNDNLEKVAGNMQEMIIDMQKEQAKK